MVIMKIMCVYVCMCVCVYTQSAFCTHGFHITMENIPEKKIPESSQKQNSKLLHAGKYLHCIYNYLLGI